MGALKRALAAALALATLSSCQLGFYLSSGYNQLKLLSQRESIDTLMSSDRLTPEEKAKLELVREARAFAEETLHLRKTDNYTKYVKLDRDSVTYVVTAAEKWRLKPYLWDFLIVGKVPYKGYFNEADAKAEAADRAAEGYDTFTRGVSAFSLLGYLSDPIYSSMLRYKPHDLVNTIIHETVHATVYIGSNADFNERMAVFLGNVGAEMFYTAKEGPASPTVALIRKENADDKIFSEFISRELKDLENWYQNNTSRNESDRLARIREIQTKFQANEGGKLLSGSYRKFHEQDLNNARLLLYKTYVSDLGDFEALYQKVGRDFGRFIEVAKSFEKSKDPEKALKDWIGAH